jgi:hypothetical protein
MPFPKKKRRPPILPNMTCSKCGGNRVIQNADVKPIDGGGRPDIGLEVTSGVKTLFGLGEENDYAWIYANLCVDCGHIDWHMPKDDAENLWKLYQKKINGFK